MSANVVESGRPWRQMVDALRRMAALTDRIPEWHASQCAAESDLEIRAAAALVQRAEVYLRSAVTREAARLEAIEADFEARGESLPGIRKHSIVEDAD